MRILHLSDLHVTYDGTTLEDLWLTAERALHDLQFDFIVITGDLTQKAEPREYEQLQKFLERRLEPRVKVPSRTPIKPRIIIVPGNHDVDWSKPVYEQIPLSQHSADDLKQWFTDANLRPETQPYRVHSGKLGHAGLFRIQENLYASRFEAVHAFFSSYYGTSLAPPHRKFELMDPTGAGDWSAHVFPQERIAFLGFNSCHRNDRYWHGAYIHRAAIRGARDHLQELPQEPGQVRAAVWHHGMESHRTRPDRLTLGNLGMLLSTGAKVGFHGHVHESIAQFHRFVADDFALVSTGTFGAASEERPDAVGNQFSIVDLHWNRLRLDMYEHRPNEGQYEKDHSRYMYFDFGRTRDPRTPLRSCAHHVTRQVTLEAETGISTVEITIEGLYLQESIVLARFDRHLCAAGEPRAEADGAHPEVHEVVTDTHREFRFSGRGAGTQYRAVRWSYRIANALALHRAELELLGDRRQLHPHIDPSQEAWSHHVQFDYDLLTLSLRFLSTNRETVDEYLLPSDDTYDITPVVERRHDDGWERLYPEEERCKIQARSSGFDLTWASPMAGFRYGAFFRMTQAGALVPQSNRARIQGLVHTCRSTASGARLRDALTRAMVFLTRAALDVTEPGGFGDHLVGTGYLWHGADRVLRTCFGEFPPDAWATEFRSGRGIAGHAFRFDRPAAWHRAFRGDFDVIKAPTLLGTRDYHWILCLPLLMRPAGKSIGVIGFAATQDDSQLTRELAELAQGIASRSNEHQHRTVTLWHVLNVGFWHALATVAREAPDLLSRSVAEMADQCLQSFLPPSEQAE